MCSYANTFEREVQATVIKSYMRGAAALWLESREKELGRSLSIQELADGLTQEYGSEITSKAALQKIESLTMGHRDCSSLTKYNTLFNKQYNLLNGDDQLYAVRAYQKGLAPALQKIIYSKNLSIHTLAEARAAATLAAAEYDAIELAYKQYNEQKSRSAPDAEKHKKYTPSTATTSDSYQSHRGRGWENRDAFKVNLGSISEPHHDTEETSPTLRGNDDRPEGQIAAVRVAERDRKEIRLTPEETAMMREENRCFRCHKPNHRRRDCRSAPATERPKRLKGEAPSRK